jgi:3-hydroxyisobutyrate dehydrogenase-like beta-hydroxyacid dehydrogenase
MTSGELPVVGFLGLGAMGSRMALGILRAGYPLVAYNRTPGRAAEIERAGATIVATPAEVAENAQVICGCLLDGPAVEHVYAAENGLIGASRAGQIYVEHGTFAPQLAEKLSEMLEQRGASFLDAPVTGGPEAASSGELTMMVGGAEAAAKEASDILHTYARRVCHVGGSGTGLQLKLVNQLLVSCHVAAAAEASAMIRRLGLPIEAASEVLNAGWAASAMLDRTLSRLSDETQDTSEATIGGLVEPQRLVAELVAQAGLSLTLMPAAAEMFREAGANGLGAKDLAALFQLVEQQTQLEVTPPNRR